ncbi:hypothetical protein KV097_02840 [Mumia sp. zg.B17]|uniref:hypothetical protein n=1 Tax=unclassified Mumia TaxID=2621872 RepID=UPI001C6DE45F|nr:MULTISPECIES: hypothetical protein [unclassified Mumia]MBW9204867.1 hypothetical protein [Mumia sp. zg.B17]MDD9350405.1 hypothetical protein [Mumia sp.]
MARRVVVGLVAAAVLVASGAGQVPAGAAETAVSGSAPPVLTSPAAESEVGGTAELAATSESPYVVFELATSASSSWIVRRTPVAAGADGIFRGTLPTAGLPPRFVAWVRACSDASLESCTTASEAVPVLGLRPTLTPTKPLPSVIDPSVIKRVSLRATGLGGFPATVDGGVRSRQVRDGDVIDVDIPSTSSVDVYVSLQQCSPLNAAVCEGAGLSLRVRKEPDITLSSPGPMLLSQNGDGLWETATSHVSLDSRTPLTARWRIISTAGATVAGPYEFTADEIRAGQFGGNWAGTNLRVLIDPKARLGRPLPAGEYRFEVEVTATATDFTKSARKSVPLFVSNAAKITSLTPTTPFFYPFAGVGPGSGVPTVMRFSPALDPIEARYGDIRYRILASNGKPLGGSTPLLGIAGALEWNGRYWKDGVATVAPSGRYRLELVRTRNCTHTGCEYVYGPVSAPFTVRATPPKLIKTTVRASARSTLKRTLVKRNARVKRARHGNVRFVRKAGGRGLGRVTTLHSLRIPGDRNRDLWFAARVRLRGTWGTQNDIRIAVVTPRGRTLPFRHLPSTRRHLAFDAAEREVGADGRLRLKVIWKGKKPVRLDQFVVTYRKYDLRS